MKTGGEVGGRGAGEEVAVGIMPRRQSHNVGLHADLFQAAGQLLGRPLAGLVFILVKDEVNPTSEPIGKLAKLGGRQTGAEGAGGVAKAGLPQDGEIEEAFDQDHGGKLAHRFPGE